MSVRIFSCNQIACIRFIFGFILFALALGANGDARSKNPSVSAVVDDIAAETIGEGKIQGLVVVVAREGSVVFERGYGLAHRNGNVEMTHGTVIDYFSIGKHITAACNRQPARS